MRRIGLVAGLLVLTPLVVLSPITTASADPTAVSMGDEEVVPVGYVTVALTRSGSTFKHPGFLMAADEEGVFVINCEGKDHEITITFRDIGETRFTLLVEYAINGHKQWAESIDVVGGEVTELQKGKSTLAIKVDPQGSKDTSRDDKDKIDDPPDDSDDPLGGSPLL